MGQASSAPSLVAPNRRAAVCRVSSGAAAVLLCLTVGPLAAQTPDGNSAPAAQDSESPDAVDARLALEHAAKVRALSTTERADFARAQGLSEESKRHFQAGRYADAAKSAEVASEIVGRIFGKQTRAFAASLDDLAGPYVKLADFPRALAVASESLAVKKVLYGPRHPEYGRSVNDLGLLYDASGRYDRAEPLFLEALETNRELGDRVNYAVVLHNLADVLRKQGKFDRAEALYGEALAIKKEFLGALHAEYGRTLNALALLYYVRGDYVRAEPLYLEALRVFQQSLGENHPDFAAALVNIAGLFERTGDFARAAPIYEWGLKIMQETLGDKHPAYASSLANLAALRQRAGDNEQAKVLYLQALDVIEATLGKTHHENARILNALALLEETDGEFELAESLYQEALAIEKRAFGEKHPLYATTLNNLAGLNERRGDHSRAESLFRESLGISRDLSGETSPEFARTLNNLACVCAADGRPAEAEPLFLQALAGTLTHWELTSARQPERRQLAMGRLLHYQVSTGLSFLVSMGRDPTPFYAALLRWKGAVLARQRALRMLQSLNEPDLRARADKLQAISGELATVASAIPSPDGVPAWRQEVIRLANEKERLEADLSAASDAYRRSKAERNLTPDELRRALPSDAVLIDVAEFSCRFAPSSEKRESWKSERRLAAFVVRRDRPVTLVDLGSASALTANVDRWRESLGDEPTAAAAAQAILRQVWDPLAESIGTAATVYVSPDGALTRFPLAALPGAIPGTYLLEERAIVIVPTPQLLPRLLEERKPVDTRPSAAESLLVVGDVDFGGGPPASSAKDSPVNESPAKSSPKIDAPAPPAAISDAERRTAARARDGVAFEPLPGAAREAEAVRRLFTASFEKGESRLLQQAEANEAALRAAAPACRYLHLATHGYFAPPVLRSAASPDKQSDDGRLRYDFVDEVAGFNPSLMSGLAMAGANRPLEPGRDDGILTAMEAAELDLADAELVTLSACETGLGATAGGEGVLGLQRAFHAAGARNVVSSLWKVDDEATAALMTLFYGNLWKKKLPAAEALRQAQLTILNSPGQISSHASRGLGAAKPLPGDRPAPPTLPAGRTEVRRWAAFQISGAGR
jgi:CHAT domain-containing protein/tetratricopeptide (TPR) repeat protein